MLHINANVKTDSFLYSKNDKEGVWEKKKVTFNEKDQRFDTVTVKVSEFEAKFGYSKIQAERWGIL